MPLRIAAGKLEIGEHAICFLTGVPGSGKTLIGLSLAHSDENKVEPIHFMSGNGVTDAGLAMLHELPVFKSWHGGETTMALLSYNAAPNQLVLRGPFTDGGMQRLVSAANHSRSRRHSLRNSGRDGVG